MVALSFLEAGLDPREAVNCSGAYRVGRGLFHCWKRGGHGRTDMAKGIYQSCDVYFYHFAQKMGMNVIASMAHRLGLGERFALPFPSQSYGTVPDPVWKERKYKEPWQIYDTVNATIGQGYMLANPTQLAVMAARIASGRQVTPQFVYNRNRKPADPLGVSGQNLRFVQEAMWQVVNGGGTAGRARLPVKGMELAGKTGTAQVRRITMAERRGGVRSNASLDWKQRDHGLFVCFAPFHAPRYAASVVIEHGGGSSAAYPIARDVMTYLFDRSKAYEILAKLEEGWGGSPTDRLRAKMQAYRMEKGMAPVILPSNAAIAMNAADAVTNASNAIGTPVGAVQDNPD
jgi:penicillin-binding protein 2